MLKIWAISMLFTIVSNVGITADMFDGMQDSVPSEPAPIARDFPFNFRWDNPHYDRTYLDNADAEADLFAFIDSIGTSGIDRIKIMAYASPEGGISHNKELSKLRSAELKWLILKNYSETLGKFELNPGGESWSLLRDRVAADEKLSNTARDKILRILDDKYISLDTRKWRLSKTLGSDPGVGDLWQYLLRAHYRYLRCGVVIIVYRAPQENTQADGTQVADSLMVGHTQPADSLMAGSTQAADSIAAPGNIADTVMVVTGSIADTTAVKNVLPVEQPHPVVPDETGGSGKGKVPFKPILGISTNLVYDATFIPHYGFTSVPSLSVEYYPDKGHWTVGADVDWSHWLHYEDHRFNQIHNVTFNTRRYFKSGEERFKGLYLLGNINLVQYGLGWDEKGWEGEGIGISAGIGNKWTFSRIYIDVGACLGFFHSRYDPYVWGNDITRWYYYDYDGDPDQFIKRSKALFWFGPTRVYISVGVDLFNRRRVR